MLDGRSTWWNQGRRRQSWWLIKMKRKGKKKQGLAEER